MTDSQYSGLVKVFSVIKVSMFPYHLKIALRRRLRNKLFTLIKVVGLFVGKASCILLILHVMYELNFDKFHANKDKLFRVVHQSGSITTCPLVPAIKENDHR